MIDELNVELFGTLETDPDAIPRGFINRNPDILNINQQNILSEMKIRMMDYNEEYLAKHPQVEALVRVLIKELIIHKPYYVRDFIKEVLSREDLETQVAMMVASKRLNTNRRHTRHYFSHTQTWQDKAAGKDEPEPLGKPHWPEPRPFRVETRRDKREYCHPHYFRMPYVFYPAEFLVPKLPTFEKKKYPQFHSKEYAKIVLENFKDVWGDPVTNFPPPMNNEEIYAANAVLSRKPPKEMTNDELITSCIRCRRTKMRNYLFAMNKKEYEDMSERYPSYSIIENSIKLRTANKFLKKAIEAIRMGKVKNINYASVDNIKLKGPVEKSLAKFERNFVPHPELDLDNFSSPIPGLKFKETGVMSELLPLVDLKRSLSKMTSTKADHLKIRSAVALHSRTKPDIAVSQMIVSTKDLEGNVVKKNLLPIVLKPTQSDHDLRKPIEKLKSEDLEEDVVKKSIFPKVLMQTQSEHEVQKPIEKQKSEADPFDEKYYLLEQQRRKRAAQKITRESEITISSTSIMPSVKKRVLIKDLEGNVTESYISIKVGGTSDLNLVPKVDDTLMAPREITADQLKDISVPATSIIKVYGDVPVEKKQTEMPRYMKDPCLELTVDPRQLSNYFRRVKGKRQCNHNLDMEDLKKYI